MMQLNLNQKHKWLVPSASIIALILVIFYALGIIGGGDKVEPGNTEAGTKTVPKDARLLTVKKQLAENLLSWPGTVRSRTVAKIAPKLNARILQVKVNAGDFVKKGDIIALLDERIYQAAYNETKAALTAAKALAVQAKADETRARELYAQEAATRENYDSVVARARAAQASVTQAASAVEQARVLLGDNVLRAPFDGVISERLKEPGDMGLPNVPIAILQKPDDLRFEVALPVGCVNRIELGMSATIRTEAPPRTWQGKISEIAPEIDQQTRSQLVKADLPADKTLEHGQFGWLLLSCSEGREALFIPSSAVLHYGQLEAVKIVENGRIYTRHIRTGKQQNGRVEILSGLHEGETIMTDSGLAQ